MPKSSQCQIAAYRVPAQGAVVVVVGRKTATSGGRRMKPGNWPLKTLKSVKRPSFECFGGHLELAPPVPRFWEIDWDTCGP